MPAPYESTMQRNDSPQGDGAMQIPLGNQLKQNDQGISKPIGKAPELSFGADFKNQSMMQTMSRISNKTISQGLGISELGKSNAEEIGKLVPKGFGEANVSKGAVYSGPSM